MFTVRKILLTLTAVAFMMACGSSSSDDEPSEETDTFDRGALLTNISNNIIIPAFQDLVTKLSVLESDKDTFITTPDQTNLDALRASWLEAYKVWQYVEMFNIGEAEALLYGFQMNVYPTNTIDIENNVSAGTYDLTSVNNNDAVGFPAVDYLLYGVANDDTSILAKFAEANYKNYLSDVINQMKSLTETVLNDWTGSYKDTFVSQTGNTATSALNKFTNDYVFYYEKGLRANKIGIPAGVFSTDPLPEKVEGFYGKSFSKELVLEALNAVQDLFNGKAYTSSATGESFKTYLQNLERNDLVTTITTRFNDARQKLEALNDDLNSQINTDNTKMTEAYDALQLAVVSLKVDMLQAFNISVDYVDADGD
ncbi:imelysin family protein [Flavivirga aquimarina]|uniref:Imelysin family protein n=1 Tax=Flavivirga aquimarina TaxID=2027862 RepID=A0ABT8WBP1_9FLAO|nr:imelysin family protein [Flavivirga aquimarina]MDO5970451.1 imelysin family protein [Flavivirga aquimarina]